MQKADDFNYLFLNSFSMTPLGLRPFADPAAILPESPVPVNVKMAFCATRSPVHTPTFLALTIHTPFFHESPPFYSLPAPDI